jgi:hypothetical protein
MFDVNCYQLHRKTFSEAPVACHHGERQFACSTGMVVGGKTAKAGKGKPKNEKEKTKLRTEEESKSEETEKLQDPTTTHTPHDLCRWLLRPLCIRRREGTTQYHAHCNIIMTYILTKQATQRRNLLNCRILKNSRGDKNHVTGKCKSEMKA